MVLSNRMGLHARPSTQLATLANRYAAEITISKDDLTVDAKSVLELLMLGAECGSELVICGEGRDAAEAVAAIAQLIESRFGETDAER